MTSSSYTRRTRHGLPPNKQHEILASTPIPNTPSLKRTRRERGWYRMNCLPPSISRYCPYRSFSRPWYLLPPPSRSLVDPGSRQLHNNGYQYTIYRYNYRPNTPICLSRVFNSNPSPAKTTGLSWSNYHAPNGPKPKYSIFRPCWRWRSYSLPALILIFWPPRSLYFNSSSLRYDFSYHHPRIW